MKDIKVKRSELVHVIFFVVYSFLYLTLLIGYGMGSEFSRWRYGVLLLAIFIGFISIIKRYGLKFLKKTKYNELLWFIVLGALFFIESLIICITKSHALPTRVYVQIFLMVSPAIYAFCVLNLLNTNTIARCFKLLLYLSVILYFTESRHSIADFLDFSSYSTLFTKYSFTESAIFSEVFLQLFLFFNYFRNIRKDKDISIPKSCVIISFIFTILCGKRLAILVVAVTPVINLIIKKLQQQKKKTSHRKLFFALIIIFVAGTIIYTLMLQGKIFENLDVYWLTTGRDYILSLWERQEYVSYGYGSSMLIIGRYLELDLVQVYLELGIVSLILFCATYLNSAKKNIYSLFIMSYCIMNMLTASSLPHSIGWIIVFISVKVIECGKEGTERVEICKN